MKKKKEAGKLQNSRIFMSSKLFFHVFKIICNFVIC